ncbi:cystathionine gamma-lyase [Jannaschia sp. W003]|uniref:cystathionine gamma-lyase n=1 Tax=Jannaschia sp. W003 TaxID=2867012 RepID=UPI0021A86B7A|nr:cystathionine gamma-lyase [Jannaschia sp. W003]UWQ22944.1 cystathionine gamma-lyase [Jannaschia sp. W003]
MLPHDIQAAAMAMLHHRTARLRDGDPVAEPLVTTSTFRLGDQPPPDAIYGRYGTPNVEACEARLGHLEGAPCTLFAAGMGAIAGVMLAALKSGDRVVLPSDGYFHSRVVAGDILAPFGVEAVEVPTREMAEADLAGAALVLIETPSNPGLDLLDIEALAARAHAAGARLAVDNTFCTGLLQRPLDLGADIVVAADTKAAGGHSDLILGHAATRDEALTERLRAVRKFAGMIPGPFEAWMLSRSLETLELRMERMCANAAALADALAGAGVAVRWPGRPDHPDHALAARQMRAPGLVLGADFGGRAAADRFIEGAGILAATSFGGTHTSADRRARWGDAVPEGFLRLSAGIEPTAPLLEAARRGLAAL